MTIDDYLALITSQHRNKPRFEATVSTEVDPYVGIQRVMESLPESFDLDTATGVQLDVIGEWAGRSRRLPIPLTGVYFAWDDTTATGWEGGTWRGPYDPDSGLIELPDDAYRTLLKAKIASNNWDGTIPGAYTIWDAAFNTQSILVLQDNQDMSMIVGVAGQLLGTVERALLTGGYIPLKPAGVQVHYYTVGPAAGKLMAWDCESTALGGWDVGQWAAELYPTT